MRGPQVKESDCNQIFLDTGDNPWAVALVPMLRLHWFIRLRWLFLAGAAAALAFERFAASRTQRPWALGLLVVALAIVNLAWLVVSHFLFRDVAQDPAARRSNLRRLVVFANAQVAVDLLLLTGILRYTGGVENPLAVFYLFHMAIVSLLLKRSHAVLQGLWAISLYTMLVVGECRQWLTPHYDFLPSCPLGLYARPEYAFTALVVVACGIVGMLYFTSHIAARFQSQERELERANAALRQSQRAIQDLQQRRSRFMQTAAHQLKSPLAVIQTMIELIRSRIVPPEAIPGTCDKIIRRCQDGIVQVTELLTLARVQEADPSRHRHSEADVREVLQELYSRFKPLADDKHVELTCSVPDDEDLVVCVDPRDLRDCVGNLIENAIKYTPGPGRVSVTAQAERSGGTLLGVLINVTDTGIGIDPSLVRCPDGQAGHEPMFDAFRRGPNAVTAGVPGTGLGLSIVREVVEQSGGRLIVSSSLGRGSSFTAVFPSAGGIAYQLQARDTRASAVVLEIPSGPEQPAS